jgi:hypothetical protein
MLGTTAFRSPSASFGMFFLLTTLYYLLCLPAAEAGMMIDTHILRRELYHHRYTHLVDGRRTEQCAGLAGDMGSLVGFGMY